MNSPVVAELRAGVVQEIHLVQKIKANLSNIMRSYLIKQLLCREKKAYCQCPDSQAQSAPCQARTIYLYPSYSLGT